MSKNKNLYNNLPTTGVSSSSGYPGMIIYDYHLSDSIGRLLTLIEAAGLQSKQEEALKSLVRQEIWGIGKESFYISGKQVSKVLEENKNIAGGNGATYSISTPAQA